jgi:hypothetical protein
MRDQTTDSPRWTLRDLPFAARLALAAFLISVGIGYFSALVQLHFQHATPGEVMPTAANAIATFHGHIGDLPESRLVRLITADENLPFNGNGQMSSPFTRQSVGWNKAIRGKAVEMRPDRRAERPSEAELEKAEVELRKERETEKQVVVAWLKDQGANRVAFEKDSYPLPAELSQQPFTKDYLLKDDSGICVKIQTLWNDRCARCHMKDGANAKAAAYPLNTFATIEKYNKVETSSAMSLTKLAQTTHVHLLGFSMLYGLTGLILALTRWPAFVRVPLAPLALIAQVADISFWWLARLEAPYGPMFASWIPISGGIVGASLGLQILLSVFDLFGGVGKVVLFTLAIITSGAGYIVKEKVIDPHIAKERAGTVMETQ